MLRPRAAPGWCPGSSRHHSLPMQVGGHRSGHHPPRWPQQGGPPLITEIISCPRADTGIPQRRRQLGARHSSLRPWAPGPTLSPHDPQPRGLCPRAGVRTPTPPAAHACDFPASPGRCGFPRAGPGVRRVCGPHPTCGGLGGGRVRTGVFAPVGPCAWLGAGAQLAAAPGALQGWEQGRAGGTCPTHSNSIPAAVPPVGKTPGGLSLMSVLSPPAPSALGSHRSWAGAALLLGSSELGAWQGDPPLCRSLHHQAGARS